MHPTLAIAAINANAGCLIPQSHRVDNIIDERLPKYWGRKVDN
jgi:hypothetical protein